MNPRTVHFPLVNGSVHDSEKAEAAAIPAPAPPDPPVRGSVLIWGRMVATARRAQEQLKHLPDAERDYHGTLRVILTAARSLEADARLLLKVLDEGGR